MNNAEYFGDFSGVCFKKKMGKQLGAVIVDPKIGVELICFEYNVAENRYWF